jgi:hypothetical protein
LQSNEKEYNALRAELQADYRAHKSMFKEKPQDKRMRLKLNREYMRDYRNHAGVQARILNINKRVFHVSCACHT